IIMTYSFLQAEDGIRDFHVTGVQTCALPISDTGKIAMRMGAAALRDLILMMGELQVDPTGMDVKAFPQKLIGHGRAFDMPARPQIGRASCRERVSISLRRV